MAEYTIRLSNVENLGLNAFNKGHKILKNYLKMAKNQGGTLSYEMHQYFLMLFEI